MQSNETTFATMNYTIKQGDSFWLDHTFQNEDATPTDLTGRTFSLTITQWATTINASGTVPTPANWNVTFSVTKTQMAALVIGEASYEAKWTSWANTEQTYLVGNLIIT